ncbi:MAG: AMP-binding protein [Rhizobiales bacterium]|nr:AMP-binding protein [Hyphomicrobiales bacterium]
MTCVTVLADATFAELASALRMDLGLPVVMIADAEIATNDNVEALPANPTCLIPTSGSTGHLKLVALAPTAVLARNFEDGLAGFKTDQHLLGTFALDSISARQGLFLRFGSWTQLPSAALTARPAALFDAIEAHQITTAAVTNSLLKQAAADVELSNGRWHLESLKRVGIGGEPATFAVMQRVARLLERHGASSDIVRVGYGTTETGSLVTGANPLARSPDEHEAIALGSPLSGISIRIAGDNGQLLSEGQDGEVQILCPERIFSGYWGETDVTAQSFTPDGWWRTGDLGRIDRGILSLRGRIKELLVVHGKKIALASIDAEMETVLMGGERAFSCAVEWPGDSGEQLAVVATTADAKHADDIGERIRRVVARRFGLHVHPVLIATADEIPMAANGKLRRSELAMHVRQGTIGTPVERARQPARHVAADITTTLERLWRDVLDINDPFDHDATFFELGGDSLRAAVLDTLVSENIGASIPSEAFFTSPTFTNLVAVMKHASDDARFVSRASSELSVRWPLPANTRNRLLLHLETWEGHRPTRDRLIVGANTSGTKAPLFWLFHDAVQFRQLAASLGAEQPLYALRTGANVLPHTEDNMQMLALRYVCEIEDVYPKGPIFLGGACEGADIALAAAQHLLRRGRHIPVLVLTELGGPAQPYAGHVLLHYCHDSLLGNPHLRFRNPELAWHRLFATCTVVDTPGTHANAFDNGYVEAWSRVIAEHMEQTAQRAGPVLPAAARQVEIEAADLPSRMSARGRQTCEMRVRNVSPVTWPAWSQSGLALGNRWLDEAGHVIGWIDGRTALPELAPGEDAWLQLPIAAPQVGGTVELCIDVVEEGVSWFNQATQAPLRTMVEIHSVEEAHEQ